MHIQRHTQTGLLAPSAQNRPYHNDLETGENAADVTSYRPISLLPTIAKVFGKLIHNKMNQE
jgi:hypothetical protein